MLTIEVYTQNQKETVEKSRARTKEINPEYLTFVGHSEGKMDREKKARIVHDVLMKMVVRIGFRRFVNAAMFRKL